MVLGKRPLPNGDSPKELVLQIEKAVEILRNNHEALLVITGGVTQPGFPSEAETAAALVPLDLYPRLRLEKESETTRQNVLYTRRLLQNTKVDAIVLVSSHGHERRARYLFKKLWPEIGQLSFESVGSDPFIKQIEHAIITALTISELDEKLLPLKRAIISLKKKFFS